MTITVIGKPVPAYTKRTLKGGEAPGPPDRQAEKSLQDSSWYVPTEIPVAFVVDDINYAIMMASPLDIEDFTVGFAITEGLIRAQSEISDITIHHRVQGIDIRMVLTGTARERFSVAKRRRQLTANTSCGICGLENADMLLEHLPKVSTPPGFSDMPSKINLLATALSDFRHHQPLNKQTHSVHGAAWVLLSEGIKLVREDVGRHNAVDKIIGALVRKAIAPDSGFLLVSSRCSYEIVEKAARCGIGVILAISGPTGFALEKAEEVGMQIFCRDKSDIVQLV